MRVVVCWAGLAVLKVSCREETRLHDMCTFHFRYYLYRRYWGTRGIDVRDAKGEAERAGKSYGGKGSPRSRAVIVELT